jgi:hypothetical protein
LETGKCSYDINAMANTTLPTRPSLPRNFATVDVTARIPGSSAASDNRLRRDFEFERLEWPRTKGGEQAAISLLFGSPASIWFALPVIPQRCQRGFFTSVCTYAIDRHDDHWDS